MREIKIYVDGEHGVDDSSHDGSTPERACRTIQHATKFIVRESEVHTVIVLNNVHETIDFERRYWAVDNGPVPVLDQIKAMLSSIDGPQVPDHISFAKKISPSLGRKKELKNKSQAMFRRGGRG